MTPSPQVLEAASRLLSIKKASYSFEAFIRVRHPDWHIPGFHLKLIQVLNDFERDELLHPDTGLPVDNLIFTMAPRHSKSTYSTIEFPSYYMGRDPRRYIMTTSYNAELATDFGREVRNIVNDDLYQQIFDDVRLAKDSQSAATWRTNHHGAYYGMGLGGSTSGRPANLLVIDDPYKNRPEAESPTVRKKVWDYYQSALLTRLQPTHDGRPPKQIVIHTRWHPDDLIGRILDMDEYSEGDWLHMDFQAIQNEGTDHEAALWPERFPLKTLHKIKRRNPREFAALYQQKPVIEGGNIIKSSWWQYFPEDLKPNSFAALIITADTAFKKGKGNDYTAMVPMGLTHNGDIFILDMIRDRFEFHEAKNRFIQLNTQYRGKGLRAIYIEDKASGQSLIQELKRQSGMSVIAYSNPDDKVSRAHAMSPLIQGGRVYLPENAPWLDDFLTEAEQFPNSAFDDMFDAVLIGLDVLNRTSVAPGELFEQGESLLEEYNRSRDIITGSNHGAIGRSLNSKLKTNGKWKGWGM